MLTAVLLGLVLLLVLVNGFFVAGEFAIVRSRRSRLHELAGGGDRRAALGVRLIDQVDEYVATTQVGITLASIAIGFLGEPAIASLLEPVLGGVFGHAASLALAFVIAYSIITLLHVILGEQTPKMLGIARPEAILLRIARPLHFFRILFSPLITITNGPARMIAARGFGIDLDDIDENPTLEELRVLISRGASLGKLDAGEAGMLGGVFHLHDQTAREVMTPIPAVIRVNADENVEQALRLCVSSGHTRLVVVENDNPDRVRGIVHNNGLVRLYMNAGAESPIEPAIREIAVFPETKPLDDLLAELQRQRNSMCVVSDEYGRTVGIVSVEDILEEVVGEIEDETDPHSSAIRPLAGGSWYVRGHVPLGDLENSGIALPVESEAFNSVGGYVFSELGRLPRRGDVIAANGFEIRVESVRENRIVAVLIRPAAGGHDPLAVTAG